MAILTSLFAALLEIVNLVLGLYIWVLIISAVLSWLAAFDIVNTHSRFVRMIGDFCYRMTEPALRHIRRFIPAISGIDISPVILILAIMFVQSFIRHLMVS